MLLQDGLELEWNVVIRYVRMIAVHLDCRLIWMQVNDGLLMVSGLLRVVMSCKIMDFFSALSAKLVSLTFLYYKAYLRLLIILVSVCSYYSSLRIYDRKYMNTGLLLDL